MPPNTVIFKQIFYPIDAALTDILFHIWVDLGVMAMKEKYTFPRSLEVELHYQMQISVIPGTLLFGGDLLLFWSKIP